MKTTDFIAPLSSKQLNESMFKKFGAKIDLNKYTREQLEDYRNILRTKIHQTEAGSKFNELLSNENYQRDKHMLELLNTRIKEMLGERKLSRAELKKREEIAQAMEKDNPGMKMSKKMAIATAQAKKSAEEGIEETNMKTTEGAKKKDRTGDGKSNFDDVQVARMVAGGVPKKKAIAKATSDQFKEERSSTGGTIDRSKKGVVKHTQNPNRFSDEPHTEPPSKAKSRSAAEKQKDAPPQKKSKSGTWGMQGGEKFDNRSVKEGLPMVKGPNGKMVPAFAADGKGRKDLKKKMKEDIYRLHVRLVNESLKYLIMEDEEGKAKTITAAGDMVNDFTTWMQRVGQYQTKAIVELADAIRSDFGEQEAESFKQAVSPALSATLDTLTQQREAISHAVAVLAGEATDVAPMGQDAGMEEPPMDGEMPMDVEPDSMNQPEDGFDASDAAAGGAETSGREVRENRIRRIAESHSIISRLAR